MCQDLWQLGTVIDYNRGNGRPQNISEDAEYARAQLQNIRPDFC